MVLKDDIYRNDTVYPKRLLDVEATLKSENGTFLFVVPTSWDFHIISHTWTDAIRALVSDCGTIMSSIGWTRESDPNGTIYMNTLKASSFKDKSYYAPIMEFLQFLANDGVQRVWLDAVCINQYDNVEMGSEMHYMGGFYTLSNGCYVAPHGIGSENGYKALTTANALPRWFSRVWTLQEYILPDNLYFLVEKFDDNVIEYINKEEGLHSEDKVWATWPSKSDDVADEYGHDVGTHGNFKRTLAGDGSINKNIYFLGGMAYNEMMGTIFGVHIHGLKDVHPSLFDDFYKAFGELASGLEDIYMETLVKQIRVRYASSEEDRVLGILGLIGFKGEYELQTKRGLTVQMVDFAKLLYKQEHVRNLLINFAAAEYEGYEVNGISWAPDLTTDPDTSRAQFRRYFSKTYEIVKDYAAQVVGVQDDGALILKAHLATGSLVKTSKLAGGTNYVFNIGIQSINFAHDSDITDNLPIHTHYPETDHSGWDGGVMVAAPGIHKFKDYDSTKSFKVCDVALILLGHSDKPIKRTATPIIMVCIPIGDNKYHKIGCIHPHPSLAARTRKLFLSKPTQFVVGGVGGDLTSYLDKECQAVLKTLSS